VLESDIIAITTQALSLAMKVAAPLLVVALVVGLVMSLLQAVFQVQDQVLAMVPRLFAGGLVLAMTGGWMLRSLVDYTRNLFGDIPTLVS
jgi:flagellar biosynthesis protein FliQ